MKKTLLIAALLFLIIPATSALALPGGLLDEKPMINRFQKGGDQETHLVTDSDFTTSINISAGGVSNPNHLRYTSNTEMTITGYEFHWISGSGKPAMIFYDSEGKEIYKRVSTGNQNQIVKDRRVDIAPVHDVKTIVIRNDAAGFGFGIKEFDVYGEFNIARPTDVIVTSGIRQLDISFRAADGAVGYNLYVDGVKTDTFESTNYTLKNLQPGVAKKIQITAIHPGDVESAMSDPVTKMVFGEIIEPILSVDAKWNELMLTWQAPEDTSDFFVYINGMPMQIKGITARQYLYKNVRPETSYTAYVLGTDKYGRAVRSNTVDVVTPPEPEDTEPPEQPLNFRAALPTDRGAINLYWSANKETDLAGYNLYLVDGDEEKKLNTNLLTVASYSYKNPTIGQTYIFRLKALDKTGNVSEPAETTIEVTPLPVTDSDTEETLDYLLVKWTETPDATGYKIYLNGRLVATVGKDVREFKITKAMGYIPGALVNRAEVRATFSDGTEGGSNPGGGGSGGGPDGGGYLDFIGVIPMIETAIAFLSLYKFWIIFVLAIVFSPVLYGLVIKAIAYAQSKNWIRN